MTNKDLIAGILAGVKLSYMIHKDREACLQLLTFIIEKLEVKEETMREVYSLTTNFLDEFEEILGNENIPTFH